MLDNGRVAEVGTHAELIVRPGGLYNRMWDMQVKGSGASTDALHSLGSSAVSSANISPTEPISSTTSPWDLVNDALLSDTESSAVLTSLGVVPHTPTEERGDLEAGIASIPLESGAGEQTGGGGGKGKKGKKNRK